MGKMAAFVDEWMKIAGAGEMLEAGKSALPFLKAHGKTIGLVGAGAAGYHVGKKELDKYMLGRRVYEQMQAQGQ